MAPKPTLRLVDEPPMDGPFEPISIDVPTNEIAPGVSLEDGVLKIEHDDGSVTIDTNPDLSEPEDDKSDFHRNLAKSLDDSKLSEIATDLLEGIERDDQSRKEWLDSRARGIGLLGLKLEDPKTDISGSSAPFEGMSTVRHPLLLEATIRFQAVARGELLPATGPVKIRNDSSLPPRKPQGTTPLPTPPPVAPAPMSPPAMMGSAPGGNGALPPPPGVAPPFPPPPLLAGGAAPGMGHNGGPPLDSYQTSEELASALEKDMNHYLTVTATEYVPDTDRMLFYVGFGGDGFKKVYNCPLRRRPVSESVDAEDLIVSNAATDLRNCGRITHKIKMRKSVLKRMQILGEYRDVELTTPAPVQQNQVDQKKEEISGVRTTQRRPQDEDYTVYESLCELELDKFAPRKFKGKGLPLPYRVTLEKDSRQVLSIVRNWDEGDAECLAKQYFVQFPFVRGIGFYGLGFIHILGNTTVALTAAWREMLDAGMFANFPGFLYAKAVGRQLTNSFRVPPGGGVGLDLGAMQSIRDAVMPLPYKEVGPAFTAFVTHMEEVGQRLGQIAEINVGEGKQDAPVGTTLALIEQATKTIDAVHKRMHAAQAEEFGLLKERFKEDPEAFWRHNQKPTLAWKKEQFLAALENNDLVPVADPNNPTSLHRVAKAMAIKELQKGSPLLYDPVAVDQRVFRIVGIDPEGLFRPEPAPAPPDPRLEAIKEKAKTGAMQQQVMDADSKRKLQIAILQLQDRAKDRESKERLDGLRVKIEALRYQDEKTKGQQEIMQEWAHCQQELAVEEAKTKHQLLAAHHRATADMHMERAKAGHEFRLDQARGAQEIQQGREEHEHQLEIDRRRHEQDMQQERERHAQKLQHEKELGEAKVAVARALASVQKKGQSGDKK